MFGDVRVQFRQQVRQQARQQSHGLRRERPVWFGEQVVAGESRGFESGLLLVDQRLQPGTLRGGIDFRGIGCAGLLAAVRAFMRWVGWTLRVVFERVDDLVRVAHGPAGGVAQFVELLLVFVFVGGHAFGFGVVDAQDQVGQVVADGVMQAAGRLPAFVLSAQQVRVMVALAHHM
ncbi:Hypothetical protein BBMN68_487 [Bifidobacterium longum subsp. longum BBMN68]|nr:Hypothetical protein BBMN68_487 [Bifidobacterium longum subsp. longum BBMN68]